MDAYVLTECVISLAILLFVFFFQFRRLSRDNFRSDIRRLRDELFDLMWKNGYSFDDPAYLGMRRVLNGLLRLSNHATPLRFFVIAIQCKQAESLGFSRENPVPPTPNEHLQEAINTVCQKATGRFLHFVFIEGFHGFVMRLLVIYPSRVVRLLGRLRERIRRDGPSLLVQQGYRYGDPHLSREKAVALGC